MLVTLHSKIRDGHRSLSDKPYLTPLGPLVIEGQKRATFVEGQNVMLRTLQPIMNYCAARRLRRFAFSAKNIECRRVYSYAEVPPIVYCKVQ